MPTSLVGSIVVVVLAVLLTGGFLMGVGVILFELFESFLALRRASAEKPWELPRNPYRDAAPPPDRVTPLWQLHTLSSTAIDALAKAHDFERFRGETDVAFRARLRQRLDEEWARATGGD